MSTHSTIGYETPDGGYIGVYCNYDGYPNHMGPILDEMLFADVVVMVSQALAGGGLRSVDSPRSWDIFDLRSYSRVSAVRSWPARNDEYCYRKRIDGTLEWTERGSDKVHVWESSLVSQR